MKLEIDETDFGFITTILCRAKLMFESLGCDHNVAPQTATAIAKMRRWLDRRAR